MNRLTRSDTDRVLGGVCGGLGEHLRLDPLLVRVLFVALAMVNGMGLVLYLAMWAMVPAARDQDAARNEVVRHNMDEMRTRLRTLGSEARGTLHGRWSAGNRMLLAGAVLVGVGLLLLLRNLSLLAWLGKAWPLALVALGVLVLIKNMKGSA